MDTFNLLNGVLIGGGATIIATQILKSRYIPIAFEKHKQWTTAAVSLVAAIITEYQSGITVNVNDISQLVAVFVGTLWVAISVYNHLKSGSTTN